MTCWRCGRSGDHAAWCSMPGGCDHCGWWPHRWWCMDGWSGGIWDYGMRLRATVPGEPA